MEPDITRSSVLPAADVAQRLRTSNRRIAWTLASIATVFFAGIIATRWVGGTIGIGVLGAAVLLFLVIAIGRNLWPTGEHGAGSAGPKGTSARADAQQRDPSGARSEVR